MVGCPFNVLNGKVKERHRLFDEASIGPVGPGYTKREAVIFFEDFEAFRQRCCANIGVPYQQGMFSNGISNGGFLSTFENHHGMRYIIAEEHEALHQMGVNPQATPTAFEGDKEIEFLKGLPFDPHTSRAYYFTLIRRFGTHYVDSAYFGTRREASLSVRRKKRLSLDGVESLKARVSTALASGDVTPPTPEGILRLTSSAMGESQQIAFHVTRISQLFASPFREELDKAIDSYIAAASSKDFQDLIVGEHVFLKCMDFNSYLHVDEKGHLLGDTSRHSLGKQEKFAVIKKKKKKPIVVLKSVAYDRVVGRKHIKGKYPFKFHKMRIPDGKHEKIILDGDYLQIRNHLHERRYLYVNEDTIDRRIDFQDRSDQAQPIAHRFRFFVAAHVLPNEVHDSK